MIKNELTKQKETHRLRKQTHGCWGEGIVKNFRKVIYTLLCLKWTTTKNLLCSIWNSAQYYVPSGMGRMCFYPEKKSVSITCICMDTCIICMTESLYCPPETITTLLISYTPIQNVFGFKENKE